MIGESFFKSLTGFSAPAQWFRDWAGISPVASGVNVNENTALTYSAVWSATRTLCETIAQLPLKVYERKPDGGREEAVTHPLYSILHDAPNADMDSFSYREASAACLINWGNWYSEILRPANNKIQALLPLHASYVEPKRDDDKRIYYLVRDDPSKPARVVWDKDMLHIPGLLSDEGIVGRGVIRMARESIGMGLATEKYGAAFFGNGARPGGVLEHPGRLSPDAADDMRKHWENMHQGTGNSHKTAVLREGTTYKTIGIPPEEAQFLETRVHNISEIARWYRLPPHMLQDMSNAHYTNIEHQGIDFLKYSVCPWLSRIERAINRQLLNGGRKYYAEFTVDGVERGDLETRTNANVMKFMHGSLTLNEWRAQENMNPVDSKYGDEHFVPLNLVPLDKIEEVQKAPETQPPVKPPSKNESPPDGKSAPPKPRQNKAALAATAAIMQAQRRMMAIEINALHRAAKHPESFIGRVDNFYAKHEQTCLDALAPLHEVLHAALGVSGSQARERAENVLASGLDDRKHQAYAAAECTAAELPASIENLTQSWLQEPEDNHGESES